MTNNHPNRSRIARILAQYRHLGALEEGEDRQRLIGTLSRLERLPAGGADEANGLLSALRAWNACYDPKTGELATGAPEADECGRTVIHYERRMLALLSR